MNSDEMEDIATSPESVTTDLANLELSQRKLQTELKMKRDQVARLRELEDGQNAKIHRLQSDLDAGKARIAELEFELEAASNTCAAYNAQLKGPSAVQLKVQHERLAAESESLRELARSSETERRRLQRELQDLRSLRELETADGRDSAEREKRARAVADKVLQTFKEIEKESAQIKVVGDRLQQLKDSQRYVEGFKRLAKDAIARRDEMEEEYLTVKAKLDTLTDLLENYALPQSPAAVDNAENHNEQIEKLQKELDDERDLTVRQNRRLAVEIAQNVALCLRVDSLEMASSKCLKDVSLQTEE